MTPTPSDRKLAAVLAEYGRHHQDARNKRLHFICVPAIVFAVIGFLVSINFGVTLICTAAAILYYNRFGPKAAMQMGAVLILMLLTWVTVMPAHHLASIAIGIFVIGWTGQFAGHILEGSKPSFLEDLQYLLIGPLYVLAELKEKLARNPRFDPL
jgi:uncharacterized membrane protein YGL010W